MNLKSQFATSSDEKLSVIQVRLKEDMTRVFSGDTLERAKGRLDPYFSQHNSGEIKKKKYSWIEEF